MLCFVAFAFAIYHLLVNKDLYINPLTYLRCCRGGGREGGCVSGGSGILRTERYFTSTTMNVNTRCSRDAAIFNFVKVYT